MPQIRRTCLVGLLTMMVTLVGCGRASGPQTAVVSGKITLNGAPLESGQINFVPGDGVGAPAGAKISGGNYKADVPLGAKRVEIRAPKVVGQKDAYEGDPNSPKIDLIEEMIPPRYNAQSELKATVNTGRNVQDFSLEAPKP